MKHKVRNRYFLIKSILFSAIFYYGCHATDFLITQSGHYQLGDNLPSNGDSNGTIRIQASYVTLDLGGFSVFQTTNDSNCTGILVDPNFTDITIKNGTIYNFTGTGIAIQPGCQRVVLDNILTNSCFLVAINFSGDASNPVTDSIVKDCSILGCANSSGAGTPAIWLKNCNRCNIANCRINNSGIYQSSSNNNTYACVEIDSCTNCLVENIVMYDNKQYGAVFLNKYASGSGSTACVVRNCLMSGMTGTMDVIFGGCFAFLSGQKNVFQNCYALNNFADGGSYFHVKDSYNTFQGCSLRGTVATGTLSAFWCVIGSCNYASFVDCSIENNISGGNFDSCYFNTGGSASNLSFIRCVFSNNSSTAGRFLGITLLSGTSSGLIKDCIFYNNRSATAFQAINVSSSKNDIINCEVFDCVASTDIVGILVAGSSCAVKNCLIYNNTAGASSTGISSTASSFISNSSCYNNTAGTSAIGIQLNSSSSQVSNCYCIKNNGNTDSNSFGIYNGGSNNLFIQNLSYGNGPTSPLIENQLSGVPLTSLTTPGRGGAGTASLRISSAMSPWGNLRITN